MIVPAMSLVEAERYLDGRRAGLSPEPRSYEIGYGSRDDWEKARGELYKRLRHFNSTIALGALTDDEAYELVESLATGLEREGKSAGA